MVHLPSLRPTVLKYPWNYKKSSLNLNLWGLKTLLKAGPSFQIGFQWSSLMGSMAALSLLSRTASSITLAASRITRRTFSLGDLLVAKSSKISSNGCQRWPPRTIKTISIVKKLSKKQSTSKNKKSSSFSKRCCGKKPSYHDRGGTSDNLRISMDALILWPTLTTSRCRPTQSDPQFSFSRTFLP